MNPYPLTPAAGKRLIAKAAAIHPAIQKAIKTNTLVIVAGTTNGYVAEEILGQLGQAKQFKKDRFFRGLTLPPSKPTTDTGRLPDESKFPGDVVINKGKWLKQKTIFDVVGDLKEGDVILKGANALDISRKKAAILIGHPKGGTAIAALQAVVGKRARLILPVGLEKRIASNLDDLAAKMNAPGKEGARLLPVPGEILTELESISLLTGATAELAAAGGVCGAEGAIWLLLSGTGKQVKAAEKLLDSIAREPAFEI